MINIYQSAVWRQGGGMMPWEPFLERVVQPMSKSEQRKKERPRHTGQVNEKRQKSLDSKKYNSAWDDECLWFPSGCREASHGVSSKCKIVQRAPWIPNECTGELNQIHIQCVASCLAKKSVRFFFYLSVPTSVAVFESKKADSMQWSKQCSFVNISCRDCALEQPTARPRQCDTAGK